MNILIRTAAIALAGSLSLAAVVPSYAQVARPLTTQAPVLVDNAVTKIYWRGRGWGWGGVGAGLAAGTIIAASRPYYYAPGDYGPAYYPPPAAYGPPVAYRQAPADDAITYCMQQYRSYDPTSQTFLGYDGLRHPCP